MLINVLWNTKFSSWEFRCLSSKHTNQTSTLFVWLWAHHTQNNEEPFIERYVYEPIQYYCNRRCVNSNVFLHAEATHNTKFPTFVSSHMRCYSWYEYKRILHFTRLWICYPDFPHVRAQSCFWTCVMHNVLQSLHILSESTKMECSTWNHSTFTSVVLKVLAIARFLPHSWPWGFQVTSTRQPSTEYHPYRI
jgi:hypothetical protein